MQRKENYDKRREKTNQGGKQMKSNFLSTIVAAFIVAIVVMIGWFFYGMPELTDSERFLFVLDIVALTVALRNDIKEDK